MNEKTLKFNNIKLIKKEFHKSKQPIDLDLVIIDQIVISDEFKHSEANLSKLLNRYVLFYHN